MDQDFDAIVVGAGPAGSAAALTMARAGLQVVQFERGKHPGSKNLFGGVLYTPILEDLVPGFRDEAPLEREVTRRNFSFLSDDGELGLSFMSRKHGGEACSSYTVHRAEFDKWFAEKAAEEGVMRLDETVVEDVLWDDDGERVVGVRTERADGDLRADVVIDAEGANAALAEKAGMKRKEPPDQMTLGVKEVIQLDEATIEDRFQCGPGEGAANLYFGGDVFEDQVAAGFAYAMGDTVSVGLGVTMSELMESMEEPWDLLDRFKSHPSIEPLVRGGETVEYGGKPIPEWGFSKMPQLVQPGMMLVGDAAGFVVTSYWFEGTNLAMASGMLAGETAARAAKVGDFGAKQLSGYVDRLKRSFLWDDMKRYRNSMSYIADNKELINEYPRYTIELFEEVFDIDKRPKGERIDAAKKDLRWKMGMLRPAKLTLGAWRNLI